MEVAGVQCEEEAHEVLRGLDSATLGHVSGR